MDAEDAHSQPDKKVLEYRPPLEADLVALCRELNTRNARYIVIEGFAIIAAGLPRPTGDIDLMVATGPENEQKIFSAPSTLPDNAVSELRPGDLQQYNVIRVADEILVDLLGTAGGINYDEAASSIVVREIAGVPIPFASPYLFWRMKANTHRAKDAADLVCLRYSFRERGEAPPNISNS